jgi:hypothetical protein
VKTSSNFISPFNSTQNANGINCKKGICRTNLAANQIGFQKIELDWKKVKPFSINEVKKPIFIWMVAEIFLKPKFKK